VRCRAWWPGSARAPTNYRNAGPGDHRLLRARTTNAADVARLLRGTEPNLHQWGLDPLGVLSALADLPAKPSRARSTVESCVGLRTRRSRQSTTLPRRPRLGSGYLWHPRVQLLSGEPEHLFYFAARSRLPRRPSGRRAAIGFPGSIRRWRIG
jgi:hypothetical protein